MAEHRVNLPPRIELLEFIQLQFAPLGVGVEVESGQGHIDGGKADSVDQKQIRSLAAGQLGALAAQNHSVDEQVKKKLQRINVEQNNKQHRARKKTHETVIETKTPAKDIMGVPNHRQDRETNSEGEEPTHRFHQFAVAFRHLQRDHQQRHRKPEDRIAKRFEARHLTSPKSETVEIPAV